MTPLECWALTREAVSKATNINVIEAYDKRKAKDRPSDIYSTLSLKKIKPLALPYVRYVRNDDDELIATLITDSELHFEYTVRKAAYSMDLSYLPQLLAVNEETRKLFIENEMSAWGTEDIERDPQLVNESYEEGSNIMLIIAAPLTTQSIINYADNVAFSVNNLSDEVITEAEIISLSITSDIEELTVGDSSKLIAMATYSDDSHKYSNDDNIVIWSSSDESIIEIDDDGVYTAIYEGVATITATSLENGKIRDSKEVTIYAPSVLPVIIEQPQSVSVVNGESVSFSVVAENYTSIYWQESSCTPFDPCWYNADFLPNWNTETLGTWDAALDSSGFQYRAVLTGSEGDIVYSDIAILTVTESEELK